MSLGEVNDWISGGISKNSIVAKYGAIENWDLSDVTDLRYVFMAKNNADMRYWYGRAKLF